MFVLHLVLWISFQVLRLFQKFGVPFYYLNYFTFQLCYKKM